MGKRIKPPLGVIPHWFACRVRIEELNKAIGRYLEHIDKNHRIIETKQSYECIAEWAKEIEALALFEAQMDGTPQKEG